MASLRKRSSTEARSFAGCWDSVDMATLRSRQGFSPQDTAPLTEPTGTGTIELLDQFFCESRPIVLVSEARRMRWVADLDGLMIPESSTSTKTEQGGSALVACGARSEIPWGSVKDRECDHSGGEKPCPRRGFHETPRVHAGAERSTRIAAMVRDSIGSRTRMELLAGPFP